MAVLDLDYYAKLDLTVSDTSKFVKISIKEDETHPVIKKTPSATTLGNIRKNMARKQQA